jgi:formate dehydrogenase subunit delta
MTDEKTLMRMANQIAANFHYAPEDDAVASVATHIRQFWTKRMRAELGDLAAQAPARLDPLVIKALARLAPSAG